MSVPHDFEELVLHPKPHGIEIGIRVPMPERVRFRDDRDHHPVGSCLLLTYTRQEEHALIDTLERTIEAIRRGPVPR